jgi:hypothetical protein
MRAAKAALVSALAVAAERAACGREPEGTLSLAGDGPSAVVVAAFRL